MFNDQALLNVNRLQHEVSHLQNSLEILRVTGKISNDAFLDTGIIQGGLSVISNLLEQGVSMEEANNQLRRLKQKTIILSETYPHLDKLIEDMR